jgi:dimethylargininase
MTQFALTREVSPDMGACELSFVDRSKIDVGLARQQHQLYQQALASLGCTLLSLPAENDLPDAVFVEDTALVLDEVAVMTRPGAASRQAEVASVAATLARYRPLAMITAPGTLEGGDILRHGRQIFVGLSARSNPAGIRQLSDLVASHGYAVQALPISACLHLKSAVTLVDDETVLVQPEWIDAAAFSGYRVIAVDPREPHAANALRVGTGLIYPSCFPFTLDRLRVAGIDACTVDVSELQKAEGAVTCCSLLFEAYDLNP